MKITKEWLKEKNAYWNEEDMDRAEKELKGDVDLICNTLLKENRFNDANWLITRMMTKKQGVQYVIFAAYAAIYAADEVTDADAAYTALKAKIIKNGLKILKGD